MSARHADDRIVPTHGDGSINIPVFAELLGRPTDAVRAALQTLVPKPALKSADRHRPPTAANGTRAATTTTADRAAAKAIR